jgi:hypothetical protein
VDLRFKDEAFLRIRMTKAMKDRLVNEAKELGMSLQMLAIKRLIEAPDAWKRTKVD